MSHCTRTMANFRSWAGAVFHKIISESSPHRRKSSDAPIISEVWSTVSHIFQIIKTVKKKIKWLVTFCVAWRGTVLTRICLFVRLLAQQLKRYGKIFKKFAKPVTLWTIEGLVKFWDRPRTYSGCLSHLWFSRA